MQVCIISANTLPASPAGPAHVAGAVRQAGHEVTVLESLFVVDPASELVAVLKRQPPDVVGISIRHIRRGYTVQQVHESLEALSRSRNPFGASLMFGAPG